MVECTENKSDEKTLMKMKKIQRDANEGAKYDTKKQLNSSKETKKRMK